MLPTELADAAKLDNWLIRYCREKQLSFIAKNDIRQYGPESLRKAALLDAALKELAQLDRLRLKKEGQRQIVKLNPALLQAAP